MLFPTLLLRLCIHLRPFSIFPFHKTEVTNLNHVNISKIFYIILKV